MARTTSAAVLEIIETSLTNIDTFITTANLLTTEYLDGKGLSDELLEEIERYIAAHILSNRDQRVKTSKVDILSETYTGQFGMGLNMTQYGQTAILLDTTGTLKRLTESSSGKRVPIFGVMGYHE